MQKLVNQTYQLAENAVESFRKQLILDEKREATIQKYTHDVRRFLSYHGKQTVCKEDVIQYKAWLAEHYAVRSTNSMLIALNQFLRFQGAGDCCVKPLKVQRQTFCDKKKELSQPNTSACWRQPDEMGICGSTWRFRRFVRLEFG